MQGRYIEGTSIWLCDPSLGLWINSLSCFTVTSELTEMVALAIGCGLKGLVS